MSEVVVVVLWSIYHTPLKSPKNTNISDSTLYILYIVDIIWGGIPVIGVTCISRFVILFLLYEFI